MSRKQKLKNIMSGIGFLLCGLLMLLMPKDAYLIVLLIVVISLLVDGISKLVFFFTMARHMVGGQMILYKAIIIIDFSLFALTLTDIPRWYVIAYLMIGMIFIGGVGVFKAIEAKKLNAPAWKYHLTEGLLYVIVPVLALFLSPDSAEVLSIIFAIGLLYAGVVKFYEVFKKRDLLSVQWHSDGLEV